MLQGRAYWSLSNAHTALGNHHKAIQFAQWHLDISREIGDEAGKTAAANNLRDLRIAVGGSPHSGTCLYARAIIHFTALRSLFNVINYTKSASVN